MAKGQRLAAAFATVAMGATVAALFVDRHSETLQTAARINREASLVAESAATHAGREMAAEATAAASIPQLRAALRTRVDSATIEDLFATEDWWLPYRDRAVAIVGGGTVLAARPTPQLQPDTELASRAQTGAVSMVKKTGSVVLAIGAVGVEGVPGTPILSLVRALDAGLLGDWSRAANAPLAITDGAQILLTSEGWTAFPALAGHEQDPAGFTDGTVAAAAARLGEGLWLWVERPLPSAPESHRWLLLGLAIAAALGAVAVVISGGRRSDRSGNLDRNQLDGSIPTVETVTTTVSGSGEQPSDRPSDKHAVANAATLMIDGPGQMFGRYELIEQIGEGGMSEIYTASMRGAEGFQRTLVVKRLKPALAQNRSAVDQFIDEARLGSLLNHPNIVQVFDFGKVDDGYYMALEYIAGRNIGQIVKRQIERNGVPLDPSTVLYMAHEILQALGYAHGRTDEDGEGLGIVHRDVSPGNIVVSTAGDIKLIDFGIVKAASRVSRTNIGSVKGNPAFMAPEQARGGRVDARSDLFAVGLVMYYGLTGNVVYSGNSPAETMYRAATGLTAEDIERLRALPAAVALVIDKALALDPANRYQTAADFAAAIEPELLLGSRAATAALMQQLFGVELRPAGEVDRYRRPVVVA